MTTRRVAMLCTTVIALAVLPACSQEKQADEQAGSEVSTPAPVPPAATVDYASLTGNAAKGEAIFMQCRSCHVLDAGVNRIGPSLHQIVGRPAGTVAGYNYSPANKSARVTWDEKTLFAFLAAPQAVIPGTKMAFAGLRQPQDRADLIAYLKAAK